MKSEVKTNDKTVAPNYVIGNFIDKACSLNKSEKFKLTENAWKLQCMETLNFIQKLQIKKA